MKETFIRHNYIYVTSVSDDNSSGNKKKTVKDGTIKKNPQKLQKLLNAVGPLLPNNMRHTAK